MLDGARRLGPLFLLVAGAIACGGRSDSEGADVRVESLGHAPGELDAISAPFSEVRWSGAPRTLEVTLYNAPLSRCGALVAGGRVVPETDRIELFYSATSQE